MQTTHIWCGHRGSGVILRVGSAQVQWCDTCAGAAVRDLENQLALRPADTIPGDGAVRFSVEGD